MPFIPYFYWYTQIGTTERCPFAYAESCPRFCHSLSFLGEAGIKRILNDKNDRLLASWKNSDLWKKINEDTSLSEPTKNSYILSNFCPEVTFQSFGHFASNFSCYADELGFKSLRSCYSKKFAFDNALSRRCTSLGIQPYRACSVYPILLRYKTAVSRLYLLSKLSCLKSYFSKILVVPIVTIKSLFLKLLR